MDSIVPDATKSNTTVSSHVMLFLGLEIQMLEEIKSFGATTHCFRKWQNTEQACKKSSAEGKMDHREATNIIRGCFRIYVYVYIYICIYVHIYIYIHVGKPDVTSSCTISLWSS